MNSRHHAGYLTRTAVDGSSIPERLAVSRLRLVCPEDGGSMFVTVYSAIRHSVISVKTVMQ
jgi:hypothetical protein